MAEDCAWNIAGGVGGWKIYPSPPSPRWASQPIIFSSTCQEWQRVASTNVGRTTFTSEWYFWPAQAKHLWSSSALYFWTSCLYLPVRWEPSDDEWGRLNKDELITLSVAGQIIRFLPILALFFAGLNAPALTAWSAASQADTSSQRGNKPRDFFLKVSALGWTETKIL